VPGWAASNGSISNEAEYEALVNEEEVEVGARVKALEKSL
jgi:hypothetical protein